MVLLDGQSMARKIRLLDDCQSEVLVLTSSRLAKSWNPDLTQALRACAARGVKVKVFLEAGPPDGELTRLGDAARLLRSP
jgi:hypothetical protein